MVLSKPAILAEVTGPMKSEYGSDFVEAAF
jgi:hypothetical protein